jgi:hypothetical protein
MAASVILLMRRTIFLALLATLLCASAARAAAPRIRATARTTTCSRALHAPGLRKARSEMDADVREYSACSDVLSRDRRQDVDVLVGSGGSGTSGGGGGGGPARPRAPPPAAEAPPPRTARPPRRSRPRLPADTQALTQAATQGDEPVKSTGT